jgi:hypothetical protein
MASGCARVALQHEQKHSMQKHGSGSSPEAETISPAVSTKTMQVL